MDTEYLSFIYASIRLNHISFGIILSLLTVILLLFFSALISGSEVAFFSLSPKEIKGLSKSDNPKSKIILQLLKRPETLLANILIANNFINIGVVILASHITDNLLNFEQSVVWEFIFKIVIITFMLLLFGEVIPKVYATHAGLKFALFTAYPVFFISKIFSPFGNLLVRSTSVFDKHLKSKPGISVEDLSDAIELAGSDIKKGKKILEGIVGFKNIEVTEIMKPRVDLVSIDIDLNFREMLEIIKVSGFSRIPVYSDAPDNIEGLIYAKDLIPYLNEDKNFKWQKLLRPAYYIPENMKINDLLEKFRVKKIHMAIVTDEYGRVPGVVTLEDVLEEIVGEITDETDEADKSLLKIGPNAYEFDAKTQINDFYKLLDIKEDIFADLRRESDSIAGIILELTHKIPEKGEVIKYKNYKFTIKDADARKIKRIKLQIEQ